MATIRSEFDFLILSFTKPSNIIMLLPSVVYWYVFQYWLFPNRMSRSRLIFSTECRSFVFVHECDSSSSQQHKDGRRNLDTEEDDGIKWNFIDRRRTVLHISVDGQVSASSSSVRRGKKNTHCIGPSRRIPSFPFFSFLGEVRRVCLLPLDIV